MSLLNRLMNDVGKTLAVHLTRQRNIQVKVGANFVADSAGLVRTRIMCCVINEAVAALMEGVATSENVDLAVKLGARYPYGPLKWADLIGLDAVLGAMAGLFLVWGEVPYGPAPLLRRMVQAGRLPNLPSPNMQIPPGGCSLAPTKIRPN